MPPIQPQPFHHLKDFDGLSERCMREHIKLYHGYVAKYNELMGKLRGLRSTGNTLPDPDSESLKVDITFALSAVKGHELFFDILGNDGDEPAGTLAEEIKKSFHSVPQFLVDLKQAAINSRGWAWTTFDLDYDYLFNYEGGSSSGLPVWNCVPIAAIDLSGHAYFYDFGSNKIAYIEAVMKAISWKRVGKRLEAAKRLRGAMAAGK